VRNAIIKPERQAGQVVGVLRPGGAGFGWGWCDMDKLKAAFELEFLPAIGEQAEVTDTLNRRTKKLSMKCSRKFWDC